MAACCLIVSAIAITLWKPTTTSLRIIVVKVKVIDAGSPIRTLRRSQTEKARRCAGCRMWSAGGNAAPVETRPRESSPRESSPTLAKAQAAKVAGEARYKMCALGPSWRGVPQRI